MAVEHVVPDLMSKSLEEGKAFYHLQTRYVVGADGMHSTVRQAGDIGSTGGASP